jgi:hypothetical protein
MTAVVVERSDARLSIEEVQLSGLRDGGVGEAVLRGIEGREANEQMRIGMLRVTGLTVPPGAGGPPSPEQVRLEALRIEGLRASGDINFTLDLATVENWLPGKPFSLLVQGLGITTGPTVSGAVGGGFVDAGRLARFAFSGVDLAGMVTALMQGQTPSTLPGRATIELDGLELTGHGQPVARIQEMRGVSDISDRQNSGTGTLALRGIRIEPFPMIAPWLTLLGYQAIEGEITGASAYEAGAGRIELRNFAMAVRDVGTLTFSGNLEGLTQDRMQAMDYSQARLIGAMLGWADASLYRRFVAMQATQTRMPEAQVREQFAAMAGAMMSQPVLAPIRDAVLRFIRAQATAVEIRVNPPKPLGTEEVQRLQQTPADLQRALGISATAR